MSRLPFVDRIDHRQLVALVYDDRHMPLSFDKLVQECINRHRADDGIQRLHGRLLDILPRHVALIDQFLADGVSPAFVRGHQGWVDAAKAVQAQTVP